ncbi:MAG: hypothetical protein RIC89_17025 [Pseudomonadales bacterium]
MDTPAPQNNRTWLRNLAILGIGSLLVRMLLPSDKGTTAVLYIFVPFVLALVLLRFRKPSPDQRWWQAYTRFTLDATIYMLASSALLWEGFICVLFFMPIFYLIVTLTFLSDWLTRRRKQNTRHLSVVFPLVVVIASLEGVTPQTSFDRTENVVISRTLPLPAEVLRDNLERPIDLQQTGSGLLRIFPMPYRVDMDGVYPGAVHTVHTRYHRWFFANTHEGQMQLEFTEVTPQTVVTQVQSDSTYFSTYLSLTGTQIHFESLPGNQTNVSLTLSYRRNLDPAWYFGPLQRYAIARMGELLIEEIVYRAGTLH